MENARCITHIMHPPRLKITLKTFMTNLKIKRCGIDNRRNLLLLLRNNTESM